jgi:phage-related minor tail protein
VAENTVKIRISAKNDTRAGLNEAKADAEKIGNQAGDEFTKAIKQATDDAGKKVAKQVADGLKDIEPKAKAAGEDAGEAVSEGVEDGADSGEGLAGKIFNKANMVAAASAVALAAGAAFAKSVQQAVDAGMGQAKLTASMGDPAEAKRAGAIAGGLYAEGVGESSDQVRDAVRLAIKGGLEGSDKELADVSRAALNLAEVFDIDVKESINAARSLLTSGLAEDATQAMDIVTGAMQMGDLGDDMIDTINEYSTQFRELGLTAPEALGMIQQAMQAGARDTDFAADALKEFAIRSKDLSATSTKAYKDLGLDSKQMFEDMSAGGLRARNGLGIVIEALKKVKDPVEKDAIAVALFGTKAEDLQDALYAMDPSTAEKALGDVGDAAGEMGDVLEDTSSRKIEKFKRAAERKLTEFGAGVIETFEKLAANESVQEFAAYWTEEVVPALNKLWKFVKDKVVPVLEDGLAGALDEVMSVVDDFKKAVDDNREELDEFWRMLKKVASFLDSDFAHAVGKGIVASMTIGIRVITTAINIVGALHRAYHRARDRISSAINSIKEKLGSLRDRVSTIRSQISRKISGMFNALYGAVDGPVVWAKSKLQSLLDFAGSIRQRVSNVVSGIVGKIPHLATGGISSGGLTLVGEQGPELVRLPSGASVSSNPDTRQMLGSGGAPSGPIVLELRSSGQRVDDMLVELLRSAIRVRGGDVQVVLGR